jgi:Ni/Co efflux regulator RcnB
MKKILALSFALSAAILAMPSSSLLAAAPAGPQDMRQERNDRRDRDDRNDRRDNRRRARTVTTTRIVREGRWRYRETVRTTYLSNGRTRTQVISRVRVR